MMLNGGMDQQNVDVLFMTNNIDIKRNEDFYSLYKWKNGINMSEDVVIGQMSFFRNGIFMSLEMAIDVYVEFVHKEHIWDKNLFPLFTSGGGDYLLIDLEQASPTYNMIHLLRSALFPKGREE